MSREPRSIIKSGFFHIIIQGLNKLYIFNNQKYKNFFIKIMKKYYKQYKIKIIAYCIMDNHAHFIIYTENINEISRFMQKINTIYAMYYNNSNNRVGYVFRDRYKSHYIYDRDYLFKCIKYVHLNPVKANIVVNEKDYKYSTYNQYIEKTDFIDEEVLTLVFQDNINYLDFLNNIVIDEKVMEIEEDKECLDNAINYYLKINKLESEKIKNDKEILYKFSEYMINKGYKQIELARFLQIDPKKICRVLKNKI